MTLLVALKWYLVITVVGYLIGLPFYLRAKANGNVLAMLDREARARDYYKDKIGAYGDPEQ